MNEKLEILTIRTLLRSMAFLVVMLCGIIMAPAHAATCSPATSQGTAPATWQTYCWIDFTSYSDATARTAAGQNFSITLSDGATLTFNVKVSGPATTSIAAPSWTGAAVGNTAFLGIPGRPVLYQTASGSSVVVISSILITPPPGTPAVTAYAFVAADAESTDNSESLQFTTNGGNWTILDQVPPITGSNYPSTSGTGTTTFTSNGAGVTGNTGAWIVGSNSPTTVTATLNGGGLQGAMFAVRFASIRLNKQIAGARVNAADQFKFDILATGSGATLATGTSTGTGNGPFTAAAVSLASGIPLTLTESMATGSVSTLAKYQSRLTCTNSTSGSSTPLPNNVSTTSYNFGTLQFGDAVLCTFTNTSFPHLLLQKALGSDGRQFSGDQFAMNINQGSTVVATTTTTGSGTTVSTGATPQYQATANTTYTLNEAASGTTTLAQYNAVLSCTNAATSSTVLPTVVGGSITPQMGDIVTCTITNTKLATNAILAVTKTSLISSDGVSATNPKSLPGAIVRYSLRVENTGPSAVDSNSVFLVDALPSNISVGTAASPAFVQGTPTSGLSFSTATDIRYSNQATAPASFAACSASPHNYTPTSAYDSNVRYICLNPKGIMAGSSGASPNFTITFNARVN